jgi:hypothetical protein
MYGKILQAVARENGKQLLEGWTGHGDQTKKAVWASEG